MIKRILFILILNLSLNGCLSTDICSDQDRGCNPMQLLLSLFSFASGHYVYASAASYGGNLAILGTGTLDASLQTICKSERAFAPIVNTTCQSMIPLVSTLTVSVNNTTALYADFQTTGVPVRGPTGTLIADDFTSFLTLDLQVSLQTAGLGNITFWTYSDGTGNYDGSSNCSDGDDNTISFSGDVGVSNLATAGTWFNTNAFTCDQAHYVLCICYNP